MLPLPTSALPPAFIRIRGARTHNLKNIDLDIPAHRLVVITGLSGSGKSSLAFDTLYAEGQRRYVESLSTYARQFLGQLDRPEVDRIDGLSPAIAIEQKTAGSNPRSTVGTVTQIHDYLRLLWARVGTPHCPEHHLALSAYSISQIVDTLLAWPQESKLMLLAPVTQAEIEPLRQRGFVRFRINGTVYEVDRLPRLESFLPPPPCTVEVVIDRLKVRPGMEQRLAESLETALGVSVGAMGARGHRVRAVSMDSGAEHLFCTRFSCPQCDYTLQELEPPLFSFNSPTGACPACHGLGQDCTTCYGARLGPQARAVVVGHAAQGRTLAALNAMALHEVQTWLGHFPWQLQGSKVEIAEKIVHEIAARVQFLNDVGLSYLSLGRSAQTLSGGEAQRIRLASQIGSGLTGVMYVLDEPSIGLHPRDNQRLIATLERLRDLGNSVIVVEHDADMIRAADHCIDMGSGAGVHGGQVLAQGPWQALCQAPQSLTGQYLSGARRIERPPRGRSAHRPWPPTQWLRVVQARGHNLQGVDAAFPLGYFTCVTGVSGSGKSTLVNDTLYRAAAQHLHRAQEAAAAHMAIEGLEHLDKVIHIDQSPLGRSPRSNPATYTGLLTPIRELLAQTPMARERGYDAGRFSFNVAGGRCQACEGEGVVQVQMHFLPDLYVPCDLCHGLRYSRQTLQVQWKGRHIAQILDMTVQEAHTFFQDVPALARKLQTLHDVGLSYLRLGQSATTLSGGEAQRVKLAHELSRRDTGRTLYVLDEPTTGLHFADVQMLLNVLHTLRDAGNTIVVIEHNVEVIQTADWLIDLGPEGGAGGGRLLAQGTPAELAAHPESHTGRFMRAQNLG